MLFRDLGIAHKQLEPPKTLQTAFNYCLLSNYSYKLLPRTTITNPFVGMVVRKLLEEYVVVCVGLVVFAGTLERAPLRISDLILPANSGGLVCQQHLLEI